MIMGLWSEDRDPKRIGRILEKIERLWEDSPDLRFGQFIQNIFGSAIRDQPIYFKEDNEIEKLLDYLINKIK
ncbi:hypothetical protein LCGC14_1214710 [marine sediment metagenome]|uniref:Uncharacterized protein n=1 Tax=marine sediment metagenome TaxID=412755 RepID=A0A0F9M0H9_9ZZZZ